MKSQDLKRQILEEFRNKFAGLNSTPFGDVKGAIEDQLAAALNTLEQGVLGEVREKFLFDLNFLKTKCGNYTWINELIKHYESL